MPQHDASVALFLASILRVPEPFAVSVRLFLCEKQEPEEVQVAEVPRVRRMRIQCLSSATPGFLTAPAAAIPMRCQMRDQQAPEQVQLGQVQRLRVLLEWLTSGSPCQSHVAATVTSLYSSSSVTTQTACRP